MRSASDSNVIRSILGLLLYVLLAQSALTAEIFVKPTSPGWQGVTSIAIVGNIEPGDAEKFRGILQRSLPEIWVDIWSTGGDLLEAMTIGEMIRENFINTQGPPTTSCIDLNLGREEAPPYYDDIRAWWPSNVPISTACACYSACFVIWSSGIRRIGGDNLVSEWAGRSGWDPNTPSEPTFFGIHRPRFDPKYFSGLDARDAGEKYDDMVASLLLFLRDMDVPTSILEAMMVVPSDDIHFLSKLELESLRGPIPAVDEWLRSKCAHLSKREFDVLIELDVNKMRADHFDGPLLSNVEMLLLNALQKARDVQDECIIDAIVEEQKSRRK